MSDTSSPNAGGFDPGRLRTAPTQMRRSRDDRYIAGVCGGLARYLNVDPVVVRVILAALTVVGGVGLVLYAAAWLLAPEEGADESILESHLPASPRVRVLGWIVAGVLAVAAVVGSGPWFDWGWIGPFPLLGLAVLIWVLARPRSGGAGEPAAPTDPVPPPAGSTATPGAPPPPARPAAPDSPAPTAPTPESPTATSDATSGADSTTTAVVPTGDESTSRLPMVAPPGAVPATPGTMSSASQPPPPPPPPPDAPITGAPTGPPPSPPKPKRRFDPTLTWLTLATLVVAIGLLRLIDETATDVNGPVYLATAIAVVAAGMMVGTWWGNGRALIPIGAVLTILLVGVSQLPVWKFGQINEAPTNAADVRSSYEMGAGEIRLDLTRVTDLSALDGRTIHLENGLGQTRVIVPEDLDVSVFAELNAGDVRVFDREANGADASTQYTDPDDLDPNLRIDIDGSLGQIEVTRA